MPTRCQAPCQALGKRHMLVACSPVKETGSEIRAHRSVWKILWRGNHLVWQILRSILDNLSLGLWNILGDSEGQGSLACCSPWGCKVGHDLVTEQQQIWLNDQKLMALRRKPLEKVLLLCLARCTAYGFLVPQSGIKLGSIAVKAPCPSP